MKDTNRLAFTMIELIMVIVVIGILSAIAVPKFTETTIMAHDSKAASVLAAARSSLATERQKRILRGDFAPITSMGNVFTTFSAAADGSTPTVMDQPPKVCGGGDTACWSQSGTSYIYTFADSGNVTFTLEGNKLVCDGDASDCERLEP